MKCIRSTATVMAAATLLSYGASATRADLLDYVKKPDKAYSWKHKNKRELPGGTMYLLHLVSQEWQGITWEHDIQLFVPKGIDFNGSMLLWNQGGKAGLESMLFGMELAQRMKVPVAMVFGIPNQPLFDGKREDALIAETFVRYLKSGDANWPLLFPMTKSLVRAMDALQEFCRKELKIEITRFIVSGASKRGWTTWLTAVADPRVEAIAPLVIDTLNMPAQIPHQKKMFGKYSAMIHDYTERGLVPIPDTKEALALWRMIDPWHYREKITVPIMIINGANDPYWTTDALNIYWNDLKAPKWVLYVPNAGHNLTQEFDKGRKNRDRALGTLSAFVYHQAYKKAMPKLSWKHGDEGTNLVVDVKTDVAPKAARLWVAKGPTTDLRKSRWEEQPAIVKGLGFRGAVARPAEGVAAVFGEAEYEVNGRPYYLSTQIRIAGKE